MTRYDHVLEILDHAIGGPDEQIGVHGTFWRGLTRDQFVTKRVRGLNIIALGDGAHSNLVRALKGEAPFGADLPEPPPGALFSRMPAGLPSVGDSDISFIQRWIDDGCPEDEFVPTVPQSFEWSPTKAPLASSRTDDIWFLDPQTGWAVNSNGQIIHTTDGFETFETQLEANVYFRCIGFADSLNGWCGTLTANNRMFRTKDGGKNWLPVTDLPANAPSAICGLSVVSNQIVYASGTNFPNRPARMLKTTNGGQTWTAWEMAQWAHLLIDCFFIDERTGWVVGGKSPVGNPNRENVKPVVLFTEDGGETWINRVESIQDQFPLGEWGWKIQFLDDRIGFVSLENFNEGAILKTTDGGATWARLPVNDAQKNANLEGVGFIDENTGWIGGWGDRDFERRGSSATTDGGRTWHDANEIGKAINRFRFFGKPVTVAYASGETVYIYAAVPAQAAMREAAIAAVAVRQTPVSLERTIREAGVYISFASEPTTQPIRVRIWDRFGAEIAEFDAPLARDKGGSVIHWDLKDASGETVTSGHYIIRLHIGDTIESCVLHLVRGGASRQ
jgi:photosystem II stability/assembly factor-like uncharacterized protein